MVWDIVDADFGGEETANFGPRQESGVALYQIETLATVSPSDETDVHGCPGVVTAVLGDLSCIAVEKHASVFKDCQFRGILALDDCVEEVEWSPDGCLLFIGDCRGKLYVIDSDSMETVFSANVCMQGSSGSTFSRIAFHSNTETEYDLVILSSAGKLMVLPDITQNAFITDDKSQTALMMKKKLITIETRDVHTEAVTDVISLGDTIITMGCGDRILAVWERIEGNFQLVADVCGTMLKGAGILQGKISTDGVFLFLLDTNHTLSLWNLPNLTLMRQWADIAVEQFQLLETKDVKNQSLEGMKLVILTMTKDWKCTFLVQNLPECENVYSLQLNAPSVVSKCLKIQETLYVAECCGDSSCPESISTVRFRCLMETNPQTRLNHLLHKNRYEEAEQFAKLFGLDAEIVQKKKLVHLLEQLSPWNIQKYSDEKTAEMMSQLWTCMDHVNDDLHVCELGMRAALPELCNTRQMLTYCRKRLEKFAKSKVQEDKKSHLQALMTKLYDIQNRLVTFEIAFGETKYSGENWDNFLHADLLQQALTLFDQRYMLAGYTIWIRHETEWEKNLTASKMSKILAWLPEQLPANEYLGLLRDSLIPSTARLHPESLPSLVSWIIQKAKNMELQEKVGWPLNAITFLKSIHKCVCQAIQISHSDFVCSVSDMINRTYLDPAVISEPLHVLITNLQHLYDLHTKYRCKLTFQQFMQETTESVTFRMLDEVVAVELIDQTLDTQIRPYIKEHDLHEDTIFCKYVADLLERMGAVTSYRGESPWEAKVIAVTNRISGPEEKCDAIAETMKWAPIPWSKEIDHLVKTGLQLNHAKVIQLEKQCHIVEMKKLMMKYGLKNMAVPQRGNAEKLLYLILSCSDQEDCMEDALTMMRSYQINLEKDLYIFRLRILIIKDKVEDAVDLLKSLSPDMAYTCGLRILSYAKVVLNDMLIIDKQENEKIKRLFTEAGIYIIRNILCFVNDHFEMQELQLLLNKLQGLNLLQVEYGKYLTLDQYDDENIRRSVLVNHMTNFFLTRSQQKDSSEPNFAKMYRLADILLIPRIQLQGELAIEAARTGQVQAADKMCRELFESDPSTTTADMVYKVAMAFVHLQANAENENFSVSHLRGLPSITYRLACQAASLCLSDKLVQYLELCKTAELTRAINNQCEMAENAVGSEDWSPSDMFTDFTLDTTFKEDALVMNSAVILPLVSQYQLNTCLLAQNVSVLSEYSCHEDEKDTQSPVQLQCSHIVPILQHLKDNNSEELAYCYAVHLLSTATQHITKFDMGFLTHLHKKASKLAEEQKGVLQVVEGVLQPWIKSLISVVLMKIFNSQNIDHRAGLMYLASRSRKEGQEVLMKIIKSTGYNYKKLKALAKVGAGLGELYNEANVVKSCEELEKNASWGHRLSKIKISFKDAFQKPPSEKIKLLPQIAQCEAADMALVKAFCSDFNMDQDEGLMLYLDNMFTISDSATQGVLAKRARLAEASKVIREIKTSDIVLKKLSILYKNTDPYDYETLEFLLNEMQALDKDSMRETSLKLLNYLKVYTRRNPPSEYELQYKTAGQGEKDKADLSLVMDMLPPNSKTRLPLHPFIDGRPWKIITPELEKDTVNTWLPIVKLLKLSSDQIYLMTVQNMVHKHVQLTKKPTVDGASLTAKSQWNWNTKDANMTLLSDIHSLLSNVSKWDSVLACGTWTVKNLPLGSEKVEALKGCLHYAELWHKSVTDKKNEKVKAAAAITNYTGMWQKLATEQVLFLHKVAQPDIISLAGNPNKLLLKLYEHPSIVNQEIANKHKPDIHKIAEEVASINGVNLEELRMSLLYRWLPSTSSKQTDSDSTVTFSFDHLNLKDEGTTSTDDDEDENLQRVLYLLQRGTPQENIVFLFNFAFKEQKVDEAGNITNMCRIRALRCLLQIGDKDAIEKLFHRSLSDIRQLLRILFYLVDFEKLHVLHSIVSFQEANKEGLVKGIWRNHRHQKTAALLVSSLCLDYNIHDLQLWTSVLQQLQSFQLLSPLEYVLRRLAGVLEMRQIPVLPSLWQNVLSTPLSKVVVPLTDTQTETCVRYFNLILQCPVLADIDLLALSQLFKKLEMSACALGCLLLAKIDHREHIKGYTSEDSGGLLDNAKHLLNFGLDLSTFHHIEAFSQTLI